jgi:predicted O-methyltransferase YrrM
MVLSMALLASGQRIGLKWAPPETAPLAKTEAEKKILAELDEILKNKEGYLNVPEIDGRMLRLLTESVNAKNVVEIGTSTGYSGTWFCLALQKTGGKLTTHELDAGRAAQAREHFKKAGVDGMVTVVVGDAHETITRLKGPIDVVFIDAEKPGYVDYLHKMKPLVRPGGLILAHNTNAVPEYIKLVTTDPDLETLFYLEGNGLAITLKKR